MAASCFYLVRVASAPISFRLKWFMCVCNQFYGHRLRSLAERPDYISMPPLDLRDAGSWIFDLQSCWMLDAARLKPALHLGGMWPAPLMQRVYHVPWQVGATPPSAILSSMSRWSPTWSNQIGDTQTPIRINKQRKMLINKYTFYKCLFILFWSKEGGGVRRFPSQQPVFKSSSDLNDFNDVFNVLWFNYAVCCSAYRLLSSLAFVFCLLSPPVAFLKIVCPILKPDRLFIEP